MKSRLEKTVLSAFILLLVSCGGSNSTSSENTKLTLTSITSLTLTKDLVREQQSDIIIECKNCLVDQAVFRWEMDGIQISNTSSFTPDFKHLGKTITFFAKVPSIDLVMSNEVSASVEVIPRETEITSIDLIGELVSGESSLVSIECEDCSKDDAVIQWFIQGEKVSVTNTLTQKPEFYGKEVEVTVAVPSIDRVMSATKKAKFKRRFVTKTFSNGSMDVFLMNDGDLVWRSPNVHNWPTTPNNNFVDFKSATGRWGNILTLDESGNYQEYGDQLFSIAEVSTKFEDVKELLGTVVNYWIDGAGHHALNENGEVISWYVQENGQRKHFELTNTKVENVKQVVSSIVNSSYSDAATAVLFKNGDLIIDAFVAPNSSYQRFTRSNVKKIQGIQQSNIPNDNVEHLAIFDQQDNVEIWSLRWEHQSYRNVDKIVSKNDESSFLVIKKDGSYVHSGSPSNNVLLGGSTRATDLVQTRPGVWGVLTNEGTPLNISSGVPLNSDFLSPEFLLRDIAYSHSIRNSNSFAVVKSTGAAYFSTQENFTIVNKVKHIHAPDNFFIVVNGDNRLDSYFQRDSNRKIDAEGFSNGLGYVENVATFFPLYSGALTLDKQDHPTLVDTRDTVFGDTFIDNLTPKATRLFFGLAEPE